MSELKGRLYALREALDAVIELVEDAKPESSCQHPVEKRKYTGEMGNSSFTCEQCGAVVQSAESIIGRLIQS